jgi:hypothetical protein
VVDADLPITYDAGTQTVGWAGDTDDVPEGTGNLYNRVPAAGTTGQSLVKASDADYDVTWDDRVVDDGSIRRFGLARPADSTGATFYSPIASNITNASIHAPAGTSPRIRYTPIVVPATVNISDALIHVTTASASTDNDFYIMQADNEWQPVSGTEVTIVNGLDSTTTGAKEIVGLNITLPKGRYLIALYNGTPSRFRTWSSDTPDGSGVITTNSQNPGALFGVAAATTREDKWTSILPSPGGGSASMVLFKWTYV